MALTTISPALQDTQAQYTGFKNRIINGAVMIDQRNAGAAVTASGSYAADRFVMYYSTSGAVSFQQSTTVPTGFKNSLSMTVTSSASLGAADLLIIRQNIEGLNVSDLAWGTASASPITISFWVRSSLTGTFGGSITNSAEDRAYPFTYTISASNTWEQKSVTIAGDTTGTWLTTNGIGLRFNIGLGVGSNQSATAGAWTTGNKLSATGATNIVATNGATFYITGVQLEKGSTATSFDYRPYGTELALCQRYYEKSYALGTVPGTATYTGDYENCGTADGGSNATQTIRFLVMKRAAPTVNGWNEAGTANVWSSAYSGGAKTFTCNFDQIVENSFRMWGPAGNANWGSTFVRGHWVASAEL